MSSFEAVGEFTAADSAKKTSRKSSAAACGLGIVRRHVHREHMSCHLKHLA